MSATLFNPFRKEKWLAYVHLTRFDRPVGIELVLWSTLWAVFLAGLDLGRLPPWHVVLIFSLGATLMRGAGCAINDFADRKVDGHVTRTKHRPLADGRLTAKEAVWAFLVLSWISGALLIFLPIQVFYWSFGAVALAFIYPFMKRFTHLPQFFWRWHLVGQFRWRMWRCPPKSWKKVQPIFGVGCYLSAIWRGRWRMIPSMRWLTEKMISKLG